MLYLISLPVYDSTSRQLERQPTRTRLYLPGTAVESALRCSILEECCEPHLSAQLCAVLCASSLAPNAAGTYPLRVGQCIRLSPAINHRWETRDISYDRNLPGIKRALDLEQILCPIYPSPASKSTFSSGNFDTVYITRNALRNSM